MNCVAVSHPWSDDYHHTFTGIPPHVATLQELTVVKNEQQWLIEGFVDKVKTAIDELGTSGGELHTTTTLGILSVLLSCLEGQSAQYSGTFMLSWNFCPCLCGAPTALVLLLLTLAYVCFFHS